MSILVTNLFFVMKERTDSQICMLDRKGVGLGTTSAHNIASELLGEAP